MTRSIYSRVRCPPFDAVGKQLSHQWTEASERGGIAAHRALAKMCRPFSLLVVPYNTSHAARQEALKECKGSASDGLKQPCLGTTQKCCTRRKIAIRCGHIATLMQHSAEGDDFAPVFSLSSHRVAFQIVLLLSRLTTLLATERFTL